MILFSGFLENDSRHPTHFTEPYAFELFMITTHIDNDMI